MAADVGAASPSRMDKLDICGTRFGEQGGSSYLPTYSTNSKVVFQVFAVTVANRGDRVVSIREQLKERAIFLIVGLVVLGAQVFESLSESENSEKRNMEN